MTDVVIIGGGIAGMSACAQLAPYVKVVLLEAEPELCYHSSGRSAATYIEDYGNQVTKALNKVNFLLGLNKLFFTIFIYNTIFFYYHTC